MKHGLAKQGSDSTAGYTRRSGSLGVSIHLNVAMRGTLVQDPQILLGRSDDAINKTRSHRRRLVRTEGMADTDASTRLTESDSPSVSPEHVLGGIYNNTLSFFVLTIRQEVGGQQA